MCLQCELEGLTREEASSRHRRDTSEVSLDDIEAAVVAQEEGPDRRPTHKFSEEEMDTIVRFLEREAKRSPQG